MSATLTFATILTFAATVVIAAELLRIAVLILQNSRRGNPWFASNS